MHVFAAQINAAIAQDIQAVLSCSSQDDGQYQAVQRRKARKGGREDAKESYFTAAGGQRALGSKSKLARSLYRFLDQRGNSWQNEKVQKSSVLCQYSHALIYPILARVWPYPFIAPLIKSLHALYGHEYR